MKTATNVLHIKLISLIKPHIDLIEVWGKAEKTNRDSIQTAKDQFVKLPIVLLCIQK